MLFSINFTISALILKISLMSSYDIPKNTKFQHKKSLARTIISELFVNTWTVVSQYDKN